MAPDRLPEHQGLLRLLVAVENSARSLALETSALSPSFTAVFASDGPSGAVGLAAARHLHNFGLTLRVFFLGPSDHAKEPARLHLEILERMRVPVEWVTVPENIPDIVSGLPEETRILAACAAEDGGPRSERGESELAALDLPNARFVRFEGGLELPPPPPDVSPPPPPSVPLLRDEVRSLDHIAMDRHHIPGVVLMENAGWNLAFHAFRAVKEGLLPEPVLVLCGRGNNGGDGFVAARHLASWGIETRVMLAGSMRPSTDDAAFNFDILLDSGRKVLRGEEEDVLPLLRSALEECRSVIDALLGTGLRGDIRGTARVVLEFLASAGAPVLAADIPSGLDADTGRPLGEVPRAFRTVTFAAPKMGFPDASEFTGEVVVADIGAPWYIAPWLASRRGTQDTERETSPTTREPA